MLKYVFPASIALTACANVLMPLAGSGRKLAAVRVVVYVPEVTPSGKSLA